MTAPISPTAVLQRMTDYADLSGHDRQHLNRMMYWHLKSFYPPFFGPKPGDPDCQVRPETQALFERKQPTAPENTLL